MIVAFGLLVTACSEQTMPINRFVKSSAKTSMGSISLVDWEIGSRILNLVFDRHQTVLSLQSRSCVNTEGLHTRQSIIPTKKINQFSAALILARVSAPNFTNSFVTLLFLSISLNQRLSFVPKSFVFVCALHYCDSVQAKTMRFDDKSVAHNRMMRFDQNSSFSFVRSIFVIKSHPDKNEQNPPNWCACITNVKRTIENDAI